MSGREPPPAQTRAQTVRARAAAWLIERVDGADWSAAKQAELDAWLDEDPAHRIAYLRLDATWSRADRLAALRPRRSRPGKVGSALLRIAAGVAAVAVIAVVVPKLRTEQPTQAFVTGIGGHKTIELSDGSQVELNTNTALRLALDRNTRTVWLDKGEAYFQVRHDATRPFVVNAGRGRIVDLGTKFTVRREQDRVNVALVEGKARYDVLDGATRGQSAELDPGDRIAATISSISKTHVAGKALEQDLSWRLGVLIFDNMTLAEVATTFNRYNRQKLVIAGADVGRLTVVGTFRTDGIARFSRVARDILGLQITHHGDEIIISH